jgi:Tfp pilus assembly protein PilP
MCLTDKKQETAFNRLIHEKSPYLLQPAGNPVDWYPWGEEAFQAAKKEGKPIFLSIGYSTCHWCHVMAHESFGNKEIAQLLNKSFISIKEELGGETEEEPRTYLETLDISQLTVSAIVLSGKGNWALIRDSKGDGHIIKIGIPIGKSRGKVIRISKNEVIIREYYKDIKGKRITRDVSMKLPSVDKIKKQ